MDFDYYHRFAYVGDNLYLTPRLVARGTQTRVRKQKYISPDSLPISRRNSISPQARLLKDAINGDSQALEALIIVLANLILNHGISQNWKIRLGEDRHLLLAQVALIPWVCGEDLPIQTKAEIVSVSKTAFINHWQPKLEELNLWVKRWYKEIVGG